MFRTLHFAAATLLLTSSLVMAQGARPTRTPVPTTPAQTERIRAGVELHDKKQYDAAIATYQEVLRENADSMEALYELAYSYLEKKEYARSLEAARRGTQYRSEMLPMFYDMIATNFEFQKQPQKAVETYRQGLKVDPTAGLLYVNLAITQRDALKDPKAARQTLKEGAIAAPMFPPIAVLLGQWFETDGYRTQAFLAFSRALVFDPSVNTYALWRRVLKGPENPMAADVMQDPDMRRSAVQSMRVQPPKLDEGDFTAVDSRFSASFATMLDQMDDGATEIESLVTHVSGMFDAIAAQPPDPKRPSFVARAYVPFFVAMKERGFVEPFVYWACQRAPVPGVREWLKANEGRVREFRQWAALYEAPPSGTRQK